MKAQGGDSILPRNETAQICEEKCKKCYYL